MFFPSGRRLWMNVLAKRGKEPERRRWKLIGREPLPASEQRPPVEPPCPAACSGLNNAGDEIYQAFTKPPMVAYYTKYFQIEKTNTAFSRYYAELPLRLFRIISRESSICFLYLKILS